MSNPFRTLLRKINDANQAQERWMTNCGLPVHETSGHMTRVPAWEPEAEVTDLGEAGYALRLALPGVEREEVDVTIDTRALLTVSGVSQSGAFRYATLLGGSPDESEIRANLDDGALWITVGEDGERAHPRRVFVMSEDE